MIIVTGTKRSGTSMWMQILKAAGLPVLGDAFPMNWGETIQGANPGGFYESIYRNGVFYGTNPHPVTGEYLPPQVVTHVAVKVFVPGLVRTDMAFVHRVIGTMRHWREYSGSLNRLTRMERENLERTRPDLPKDRLTLPPILEWWLENFMLIRDVAQRQYPIHLTTYDRVIADPEKELTPVFGWLGVGDVRAAIGAIDPTLRTQARDDQPADEPPDVDAESAEVFDALYDTIHRAAPVDASLIERLNDTQDRLLTQLQEHMRAVGEQAKRLAPKPGSPDWVDLLKS